MKLIVCNIGSSSLKFQLLQMPEERRLARGSVDRVGSPQASGVFRDGDTESKEGVPAPSHREAVRWALGKLRRSHSLDGLEEIDGVGFKCVQAGEKSGTVFLDEEALQAMEDYRDLAPAHNPPYLAAIHRFREILPETPLVGVFEPGFHHSIPLYASIYGAPYDWYSEHGVRRYGYHGASHRFVTGEVVRLLGLPSRHRIISCHLGGSSSICAFRDGVSIDTSMGFTPQTGLVQGTRIGDMDPFVLPHIMKRKGLTLEEALGECSREAGLKGLSGTSGDMRDILERIEQGDERARLARDKFLYDIKRYIGAYLLLMEGLDAIAFAGGIGEKDAALRSEVLSSLRFLGFELDRAGNQEHRSVISTPASSISALVVSTDEEIVVARETYRLLTR